MPRRSRICSVIDCGRFHHAQGFCKRHYDLERIKQSTSVKKPSERAIRPEATVAS